MAITARASLSHWNYFLALESDLEQLYRFVAFTPENFQTYSIEMAPLLLTAASEVDVVTKMFCARIAQGENGKNIKDYRKILRPRHPNIETSKVSIPRFGLELIPWDNWKEDKSPVWWDDHNMVKHQRGEYFNRANLKNVLNAIGGLFLVLIFFHRGQTENSRLAPAPSLFMAPQELVQHRVSSGAEGGTFLYFIS